ncbi:MAG: hypothetical protein J6K25_00465 [Thermoguttaceae bacterium]|nr:hypothetical protein [Thermoguttaceae bacterium]
MNPNFQFLRSWRDFSPRLTSTQPGVRRVILPSVKGDRVRRARDANLEAERDAIRLAPIKNARR